MSPPRRSSRPRKRWRSCPSAFADNWSGHACMTNQSYRAQNEAPYFDPARLLGSICAPSVGAAARRVATTEGSAMTIVSSAPRRGVLALYDAPFGLQLQKALVLT